MNNSGKFLTLGSVAAVLTLVVMCGARAETKYVPASGMGAENEQVPPSESEKSGNTPALGEPDGYLGGEWNLWEFIGDSINRILFGSI